jgi:hypothetical protein
VFWGVSAFTSLLFLIRASTTIRAAPCCKLHLTPRLPRSTLPDCSAPSITRHARGARTLRRHRAGDLGDERRRRDAGHAVPRRTGRALRVRDRAAIGLFAGVALLLLAPCE